MHISLLICTDLSVRSEDDLALLCWVLSLASRAVFHITVTGVIQVVGADSHLLESCCRRRSLARLLSDTLFRLARARSFFITSESISTSQ